MIYILKDKLTPEKLQTLISNFISSEKPKLDNLYNYYLGIQNIRNKTYSDDSKPCNKITVNFCHQIVQQFLGFNVGVPVTYGVEDCIQDVLNYNDVTDKDSLLLKTALIFGKVYELQYYDSYGEKRFVAIDPRYSFDIYGDEIEADEMKAFVRMYCVDNTNTNTELNNWRVEVYDRENVYLFSCNSLFSNLTLIDSKKHYSNQVPVVAFYLNTEQQSIFEQIMSLQDAYNGLISSELDDWESFVDAYLILKNMSADTNDIQSMKTNRVLLMDSDSEAYYLTKNTNDTQINNMLDNIKDLIFKLSNAPDFSDPNFMGNSGKALQYKLTGFNNISKAIMDRMEKALRKRLELIEDGFVRLQGHDVFKNDEIKFTQNIPADELESAQIVNMLRGIVSNKTLLSILPFITDVDKELDEVKKENQENMELYSFENNSEPNDKQ